MLTQCKYPINLSIGIASKARQIGEISLCDKEYERI